MPNESLIFLRRASKKTLIMINCTKTNQQAPWAKKELYSSIYTLLKEKKSRKTQKNIS